MGRITDAWGNLGRREQLLAAVAVAVVVLVTVSFLLLGGGEEAPINGGTVDLSAETGPVTPAPGTVMVPSEPVAASVPGALTAGSGVVAVSSSGSGDSADGAAIGDWESEAARNYEDVPVRHSPTAPVSSNAIKAAGRDLERVAASYIACMTANQGKDTRRCVNVLAYGVFIKNGLHDDGRGITLTKTSSDGHRLDYTVMPGGSRCRALDEGEDCNAWTAQ